MTTAPADHGTRRPRRRGAWAATTAITLTAFLAAAVGACTRSTPPGPTDTDMHSLAERYVKLVLQVGQHDENFVDAYYGDPTWKPTGAPVALEALAKTTEDLLSAVKALTAGPTDEELVRLRRAYLEKQLIAVQTRIAMLRGERLTFDQEAARLYDAQPPIKTEADFQPAIDALERLLPGPGPLIDRYASFRKRFEIPTDKLDAVFRAAIEECRARTLAHLALPDGETFTVEYVTGKSWSAYNWYKGGYRSVIQVNTDLPITIDRAIDLACHEGYPGHHVYNALLEKHLVRDRGWVEFSIYPLFSPQSLIAEGTANFGIEVAFPGEARTAFERDRLYPLAGLDPGGATTYAEIQRLVNTLTYAGNEAARRYLDGQIDRAGAVTFLQRWGMMPKDRAEQRTRFIDQYRSYVINYNLGQDLVRAYIERRGGTTDRMDVRWTLFGELLSSPRLPSGLR